MSTWRCEVSLLVFKNIFLLVVLTHEISSTLAEKFCVSMQPCNILYVCEQNKHQINLC